MHILPPFAGQPCGTPPLHPPYHLHTCFLCLMSSKKMISFENLTAFAIFLVGGWRFNFCPFLPFLANLKPGKRSMEDSKWPADGFPLLYPPHIVQKTSEEPHKMIFRTILNMPVFGLFLFSIISVP